MDAAWEIASACVASRLRALSRRVTTIYDDALRPLGVKVSQLNVLVAIGATGGVQPSHLAEGLSMEKSTLSRNVDKLIARGWVQAEGRGRRQQLTLTSDGEALVDAALPRWREAQAEIERRLGPGGRQAVQTVVAQLSA